MSFVLKIYDENVIQKQKIINLNTKLSKLDLILPSIYR